MEKDKFVSSTSASLQLSVKEKPSFRGLFLLDEKELYSECGEPEKVEYAYSTKKDGSLVLEPCGKTNIYDLIQASAAEVDINNIMRRFMSGEDDILDRVYGTYADVVDAPSSYADMHQRIVEANAAFESLPADFREKFNNSPLEYFTQFGSAEFNAKVSSYIGSDDVVDPDLVDVIEKGDVQNDKRTVE